MKKTIIAAMILFAALPAFSTTSEIFENQDVNAVKAGIAKYILTKGGKIYHGKSYEANTFQAVEQVYSGYSSFTYNYIFNLTPVSNGTRLDLSVLKSSSGSKPVSADILTEQKIMENIKNSAKGRFLYGLGFDFDTYDTANGKIKAPKGREEGIKLTAVRYDAAKKGLLAGDIITEINGVPLKQIPIEEFATALNAKTMTDEINLTFIRNGKKNSVTLIPRLSNNKTF